MTQQEAPTPPLTEQDISRSVQNAATTEAHKASLDVKSREDQLKRDEDYHRWRRWFSIVVLIFTFVWLVAELHIILSLGLGQMYGAPFKLSDSVAIAVLTTAMATVLGLFAIFLRWLYPGKDDKEK